MASASVLTVSIPYIDTVRDAVWYTTCRLWGPRSFATALEKLLLLELLSNLGR